MRSLLNRRDMFADEHDEDELAALFHEARTHVQAAIERAESQGISSKALGLALMSEALPRIVKEHGLAGAAAVLTKLANRVVGEFS
jgi:hypothetical protein